MSSCSDCGAPMKPLFTGEYCSADCDLVDNQEAVAAAERYWTHVVPLSRGTNPSVVLSSNCQAHAWRRQFFENKVTMVSSYDYYYVAGRVVYRSLRSEMDIVTVSMYDSVCEYV